MDAKTELSRLEDYVFLSSMDSFRAFIVERDGRVWLHDEGKVKDHLCGRRGKGEGIESLVVLDFSRVLKGRVAWSWLNGWMPVLVLKDAEGGVMRLLACGDELWTEFKGAVQIYPGGRPAPFSEFEEKERGIVSFWERWLSEGIALPSVHPRLDDAWKSAFAQCKTAFAGNHPRYGVGSYGEFRSDGFPPNVLSMVSALNAYGHYAEAKEVFSYYLDRFVMDDGAIDYYGTALSEYGGILALAAEMVSTPDGAGWFKGNSTKLLKMLRHLVRKANPYVSAAGLHSLLVGAPEADTRKDEDAYLHNNMMVWRGLTQFAGALGLTGFKESSLEAKYVAGVLGDRIKAAVDDLRRKYDFIPHRFSAAETHSFKQSLDAAYANYRYLPEMLESCFLDKADALRIIEARETRGGEFHGMSVLGWPDYGVCLDNWPVASYARGLLELGERERFMRVLFGHLLHHQTPDTFTAYESVAMSGSPRLGASDWCVPAQLVVPRLLAWSFRYAKWDGQAVEWRGPSGDELAMLEEGV